VPGDDNIVGCMGSGACNYNPAANVEDGSCIFCAANITFTNQATDFA
jgi:hypothetical protein